MNFKKITFSTIFIKVGGQYKFLFQEDEWFLQHRLKDHRCHQDPDIEKENWYTMYKFKPIPRQLEEFQPCCTQYESDPNTPLSFIPVCIIKCEEGRMAKQVAGAKFTSTTFGRNGDPDVETSIPDMGDEQLNSILIETFGLTLKSPLSFNSAVKKVNNWKQGKT